MTTGDAIAAQVVVAPNGNLLVTWTLDFERIQSRAFDASGGALGGEFRLDSTASGYNYRSLPAATLDSTGDGFVVVWERHGEYNTFTPGEVEGRTLSTDGTPTSDVFMVSAPPTETNRSPSVSADPDGGFVVAWRYETYPGTAGDVVARYFDQTGVPMGDQFVVNQFTPGFQMDPKISAAATDFRVVWRSDDGPGDRDGTSVRAVVGERGLFEDGFESGDTSAWALEVP